MEKEHKSFIKTVEGLTFLAGIALLACIIALFYATDTVSKELMRKIFIMALTDILAGRGASIYLGTIINVPLYSVAIISIVFNLVYLLILFPVFIFFYNKIVRIRIVGPIFLSTFTAAQKNKKNIERYGAIGIAIFVWLPFTMTGSLVGAIIGYLIGMRFTTILPVVVTAMAASSFSWAFGFKYMVTMTKHMGIAVPAVLVTLFILFAIIYHMKKSRNLKSSEHVVDHIKISKIDPEDGRKF